MQARKTKARQPLARKPKVRGTPRKPAGTSRGAPGGRSPRRGTPAFDLPHFVGWLQERAPSPGPGPELQPVEEWESLGLQAYPPFPADVFTAARQALGDLVGGEARPKPQAGHKKPDPEMQVALAHLLLRRLALVHGPQDGALAAAFAQLARRSLPTAWSDGEVFLAFARAWLASRLPVKGEARSAVAVCGAVLEGAERLVEEQGLPPGARAQLKALHAQAAAVPAARALGVRARALLSSAPGVLLPRGWARDVLASLKPMPQPQADAWRALLGFARHGHVVGFVDMGYCDAAPRPSAGWFRRCEQLLAGVGREAYLEKVVAWLGSVGPPPQVPDPNLLALRGLIWCAVLADDERLSRALGELTRRAFADDDWEGKWAIGTTVLGALAATPGVHAGQELLRLSHKVRRTALRDAAQRLAAVVAQERGVTPEDLAIRSAPDLGLDADGTRLLDFGARRFRVAFDEQLRPFVRDEAGRRLAELPRPGKSDDAARAEEARTLWTWMKREARSAVSIQIQNLEQAMCLRRRWTAPELEALVASQPLLRLLARRLVWGLFDEGHVLKDTFRVSEDGSWAGIDDRPITAGGCRVGVPHPLELGPDHLAAWGRVLGDYEILQPFAQLGRAVHRALTEEREARALKRFTGLKVEPGRLLGLERRGWKRGHIGDGPTVETLRRALPGLEEQAEMALHPGLDAASPADSEEQELGVVVVHAMQSDAMFFSDHDGIPLGQLDPIVFSELLLELSSLQG